MGCATSKPTRSSSPEQVVFRRASFVLSSNANVYKDYTMHEVVGDGAFGMVRRATEKLTGEIRAVKILPKCLVSPTSPLRELSILTSLDHPNILRVFRSYEDSSHFYLITEFCPGGSLLRRLTRHKQFSEPQTASLLYQVLSALVYCHSRGVVHRDIKLENVLLEDDSEEMVVRLADFGAAAKMVGRKRLAGCYGTAYYLAPEVLRDTYTEKCDLWSCGILMYVLLTGKRPYFSDSEDDILEAVVQSGPNLDLSAISPSACDLISRLLERRPGNRISAWEALRHPWIDSRDRPGTGLGGLGVERLREFRSGARLKDAIHTFVASQTLPQEDANRLAKAFRHIDTNGDGRLSRDELISVYSQAFGESQAESEVTQILQHVDCDASGYIEFTEFLKASLNFSQGMIWKAFQRFDGDGDGSISLEELKRVVRLEGTDDRDLIEAIREADLDGNGVIDLREFTAVVGRSV